VWIAGMVLGVACLLCPQRTPAENRSVSITGDRAAKVVGPRLWYLEGCAVLCIVTLALTLRLWHLAVLPEPVTWDEANQALSARQLLSMPFQPLGPNTFGHSPTLYLYFEALIFRIGGMSVFTMRLAAALSGTIAVIGAYLIGRRAGGLVLGLSASSLLAVSQWALVWSRMSTVSSGAVAAVGLCGVAVAWTLTTPRPASFALSGLCLGLSALTYQGALAPAASLAGVLLVRFAYDRQFRDASWPGLVLLPIGCVAGALPLIVTLHLDAAFVGARMRDTSLFGMLPSWSDRFSALGPSLRSYAGMFTMEGSRMPIDNVLGQPELDAVAGACFLLGLGMCMCRFNHWFSQLVLFWLAGSLASGIFSNPSEAPSVSRTVCAMIPAALIAACPLAVLGPLLSTKALYVSGWLRARLTAPSPGTADGHARRAEATLIMSMLLLLVPISYGIGHLRQQYFGAYAADLNTWQMMYGRPTVLGRYIHSIAGQGYAVLIPAAEAANMPVIEFTSGMTPATYDPNQPVMPPAHVSKLAVAVQSSRTDIVKELRRSCPDARVVSLTPGFDHTQVAYYVVLITRCSPSALGAALRPTSAEALLDTARRKEARR
jgi:hypothetical protein